MQKRHIVLFAALLPAALSLSGCFPVVATGVGTGVVMAEDRRSSGAFIGDEEIEWRAALRVREAKLEGVHANFTSYNRRLLITGEAGSDALKARVADLARGVTDVKEVLNELAVAASSSLTSRSNDAYLTTKVKARFLDDARFSFNHVKVVTERGTVYLMGLVKKAEGDAAAEIAASTGGVLRVVKVFEYLD